MSAFQPCALPISVLYAEANAEFLPKTENKDVFARPKGVLRYIEEGAPVIENSSETMSLMTVCDPQTKLVFD